MYLVSDHDSVALGTECFPVLRKEQTIGKPVAAFLSSAQSMQETYLADKAVLMPLGSHCVYRQIRYWQLTSLTFRLV
jgi:hypothetical protein